jgi:hypothetical protein
MQDKKHSYARSNGPKWSSRSSQIYRQYQSKAITGWLDREEAQYCVDRSLWESKDVDESVVSEYKPKLLELVSPYEPKQI